jgi:hypothetical protein
LTAKILDYRAPALTSMNTCFLPPLLFISDLHCQRQPDNGEIRNTKSETNSNDKMI